MHRIKYEVVLNVPCSECNEWNEDVFKDFLDDNLPVIEVESVKTITGCTGGCDAEVQKLVNGLKGEK